jgi:hypothetical protein
LFWILNILKLISSDPYGLKLLTLKANMFQWGEALTLIVRILDVLPSVYIILLNVNEMSLKLKVGCAKHHERSLTVFKKVITVVYF